MNINTLTKTPIHFNLNTKVPPDRISLLKTIQNRWNRKKGILMLKDIKKSRAEWR